MGIITQKNILKIILLSFIILFAGTAFAVCLGEPDPDAYCVAQAGDEGYYCSPNADDCRLCYDAQYYYPDCCENAHCDIHFPGEGRVCEDHVCVVPPDCTDHDDCGDFEVCESGECIEGLCIPSEGCTGRYAGYECLNYDCICAHECCNDEDCESAFPGEGMTCEDNACVGGDPDPVPDCSVDSDCGAGYCCSGGTCYNEMETPCLDDPVIECETDDSCDACEYCFNNECWETENCCTDTVDCDEAGCEYCWIESGDEGVCLFNEHDPACQDECETDDDCDECYRCASNECVFDELHPQPGCIGCSTDADCGFGYCCSDGSCLALGECEEDDEEDCCVVPCPTGEYCAEVGGENVCVDTDDCEEECTVDRMDPVEIGCDPLLGTDLDGDGLCDEENSPYAIDGCEDEDYEYVWDNLLGEYVCIKEECTQGDCPDEAVCEEEEEECCVDGEDICPVGYYCEEDGVTCTAADRCDEEECTEDRMDPVIIGCYDSTPDDGTCDSGYEDWGCEDEDYTYFWDSEINEYVCILEECTTTECPEGFTCDEQNYCIQDNCEDCPEEPCEECEEPECPRETSCFCVLCVDGECEFTDGCGGSCTPCPRSRNCVNDAQCYSAEFCDGTLCVAVDCDEEGMVVVDHECVDREDYIREYFETVTTESNVDDERLIETIRDIGTIESLVTERVEAGTLSDDLADQIAALLAEAEDNPAVAEENLQRIRDLLAAEGIVVPVEEETGVFGAPVGSVLAGVAGAIAGILGVLGYLWYRKRSPV